MEYKSLKIPCNPYLPSKEHVPDGEPHVFNGKVYVYGSHDVYGSDRYCTGSYVCWSCPVNDLSDWKYEGVIYEKGQDPLDPKGDKDYYAPDVVQGLDKKYYLYYSMFESYVISVAVSDSPAGPFKFYGHVKDKSGHILGSAEGDYYQFDPALLRDDDDKFYLYSGQDIPIPTIDGRKVMGSMVAELDKDMLTIVGEQKTITSRAFNCFDENPFFEASSIRKHNGVYYFIYSSLPNVHYLCYATSSYPDKDFEYKGALISNVNIYEKDNEMTKPENAWGNNHGSILFINDDAYIFYHKSSGKNAFSRVGCVQKLVRDKHGDFLQAEMTSTGTADSIEFLGSHPAYSACGLQKKDMPDFVPFVFFETSEFDPFVAEDDNEDMAYISNINDGARVIFRYFEAVGNERSISIRGRAKGEGTIWILQDGVKIGEVEISDSVETTKYRGSITPNKGKSEIILECHDCKELDIFDFEVM